MTAGGERIAFVGLGIMGLPMAVNLVQAGFDVAGYNRSPAAVQRLGTQGGTVAGSSSDTGSSGTGSTDPGSGGSSSPLPFTGAPITKFLGAGLLAIGVALMLLGWANRRVRLARSNRSTPR